MTERPQPGMEAVIRHLRGSLVREGVCYEIAREVRAEINGLWAAQNGPVSGRPGKKEVARWEARIDGIKWALGIALGIPLADLRGEVDLFLEEFKSERLKASKK